MIEAVVIAAAGIIAQVAPGLLAAWTGAPTDAEAIEGARGIVAKLPVASTADDADLATRIAGGTAAPTSGDRGTAGGGA